MHEVAKKISRMISQPPVIPYARRRPDSLPHLPLPLPYGMWVPVAVMAGLPANCYTLLYACITQSLRSIRSDSYGQCVRSPQNLPQIRCLIRSARTVSTVSSHGLYGQARSPVRPVRSPVRSVRSSVRSLRSVVRSIRSVATVTQKGINRAAE